MAKCLILEFQGVGRSEYDDITAKLGIDATTGTATGPPGCSAMPAVSPTTARSS